MATKIEFSWRSYLAPTPKLVHKFFSSVLVGCLSAVPFVATLRVSDEIKYLLGVTLGALAIACRVVMKFFSDDETPVPATVEEEIGEPST